jgi:hypothetical protein
VSEATPRGLDRLELRVERLQLTFRFTFAFHAREVRFECDDGDGFQRIFPETFSFHGARRDPTELFLQLDDLLRQTRLLAPEANRRDARSLVSRLLAEAPRYLERMVARLESEGRLAGRPYIQFHQDAALLAQVLLRFLETQDLDDNRSLRVAGFVLRKRIFESLRVLTNRRVSAEYLEAYVRGEVDPVQAGDDPSESGFFHALESGDDELVDRIIVRMAERAFYLWLEGVCLDEDNQAFEKEDSPFADRETEVLRALVARTGSELERGEDLTPFLRRSGRDSTRLLKRLETWFLRQYDIRHAAAVIAHAANLARGKDDGRARLSWHRPAVHASLLGAMLSPFVASVFAYERAPAFFDLICSLEVIAANAVAAWFLVWRFCLRRDLTVFHASVPRIAAGVIVGYLPVFLIDEVWDLASRSAFVMTSLAALLGLVTLLYIFIEVQRRLGDPTVAFARARAIFLLGSLEAFSFGVVVTSLVGGHMVSRTWSPEGRELPVETLRSTLEPLLGQLPRVVGLEPVYVFPSVLLTMTFLSFFIGVFLQLMWEDLPITEPL